MPDIAAIVLAAGRATRFGAPPDTSKVLALLDGKPLVRHVVETTRRTGVSEIVVVIGHAGAAVRAVLADCGVRVVANPDYAEGIAASLRVGIEAIAQNAAAALVLLADMPLVRPALIDDLIAAFDGDCDAVVPCRGSVWGNPVLLSRRLFPAVATLTGDRGARTLLTQPGRRVVVLPVEDPAIGIDVDTPAVLDALNAARKS